MTATTRNLAILGSTGSVGASTLDVVSRHPGAFRVVALTARNQVDLLYAQCRAFNPEYVVVLDAPAAAALESRLVQIGSDCVVLRGADALEHVVSLPQVDTVMAAIVGIAGLKPTFAAAQAVPRAATASQQIRSNCRAMISAE